MRTMSSTLTLLLALTVLIPAFGQAPAVQWQRSLGGSMADELFDLQRTADGGYVMTGYTTSQNGDVSQSLGEEDVWVVKLDADGMIEWERSLGGSAHDEGRSIIQTSDGGFLVAGTTFSSDGDVTGYQGDRDIWIVRLDGNGNLLWQKSLGGPLREEGGYIALSPSGECYVAGSSKSNSGDLTSNFGNYDLWVAKLNTTGDVLWQKNFGGSAEDWALGICSTTDGGVIVSGYTNSQDGDVTNNQGWSDAWVLKLAANGDLDWKRTYGGSLYDSGGSIQQTTDGGYIMAASSASNNGDLLSNNGGWDMWVVKLDPLGVIEWQSSFGGTAIDIAKSVSQTSDEGFIVAGHSASSNGDFAVNQGNEDMWILRLDPTGALLWKRSFGGSTYDWAAAVQQTGDGGFILGGTTFSNNGDVLFNNGFTDLIAVKFAAADPSTSVIAKDSQFAFQLFPNPSEDLVFLDLQLDHSSQIRIGILDESGKELLHTSGAYHTAGAHRLMIPIRDLSPGTYHMKLQVDGKQQVLKLVKL